jgi:hypothetical protein
MDDLGNGAVYAGVVVDDEHAAHQREDRAGQPQAVASTSASLAGPDGSEYGRTPPAQQMRPGTSGWTFAGAFSRLDALFRHTDPTVSRVSG